MRSGPTDAIDNRYVLLEKLGEGGMGAVYAAHDRLTGQRVAIKRVLLRGAVIETETSLAETLAADAPLTATEASVPWEGDPEGGDDLLLALAHEFRTLASIRHPHVISVLDYGFESRRRPFFTMELLDGARPLLAPRAPGADRQAVRLLLQVLEALTYLHRRGVLHRDLKPANVLILGEGDAARVKVLDFGIACVRERADRSRLAGTIAYMAPELFGGGAPSEASDLWAVGVMAHELLVGAHPLGDLDSSGLARWLGGRAPIAVPGAGIDPALAPVLRRALSHAPGERYPDATSFAQDLARAAGIEPPAETAEIRESFLQAARFVARDAELSALHRALDAAIAGRGSLWLVGGESGVGKSRLLDELRTQALVAGARVVRGQAVSAGGAAYQVWQGALRPLCLDAALGDVQAGVLRAAVPDIGSLLERRVPDPPELDPLGAQARLHATVTDLLLGRRAPLVVLLEDLHWAEPASLGLLLRLSRALAGSSLLVIGTYRDDERPALPDDLPGARSLPLRRLSSDEVASLSASMLGEIGRRSDVVALLERETEGNAFFLVEVVRALAEREGALARIGAGSIPSRVMAGGVQAVLARRLGRVPAEAGAFLRAAAVLGRELDLAVLRALPGEDGARADAHLSACAAAAVVEVSEERWRFTHDKLREALLAETALPDRALWHRRVAEAMERAYAGDLGPRAAALAHHFDEAGDLSRAAHYHLDAGTRATQGGAMLDAIAHLERALSLLERAGGTAAERARALGRLSQAYHGAGKLEECARVLERMIGDAGFPPAPTSLARVASIARRAAAHAAFRIRPAARADHDAARPDERVLEALDALMTAGEILPWTRSPARLLETSLAGVVMAERLRDPGRLAAAYAAVAYGLATTPLAGLLPDYLRRALALLEQAPEASPRARAFVKMIETIVHASRGDWETAEACLRDDLEEHRRRGDWRLEQTALLQGAALELHRGRPARALDAIAQLEALAGRTENGHFLCYARCLRSVVALRAGEIAAAAGLLVEAGAYDQVGQSRVTGVFVEAASGLCAARRGDLVEARRRADAALEMMPARPPFLNTLIEGPPAVVEVYATLWSRAPEGAERSDLERRLDRSLAALEVLGGILPIARSRSLVWKGRCAVLRGRGSFARRYLRGAIDLAQRHRVPFDEALARQALAAVDEARGEHGRAAHHRRLARRLFEQIGARWHMTEP